MPATPTPTVPMLSTGAPSTLVEYRKLCVLIFGLDSGATRYIQSKIDKQGENAPVLAAESQMIYLLTRMHGQGMQP